MAYEGMIAETIRIVGHNGDPVSAYVARGGETFGAVHVRGAEMVARGAAAAGVARLVFVSGIGADPESRSPYIRARGRGERAVQREFPGATIVKYAIPDLDGSAELVAVTLIVAGDGIAAGAV